MEELAMKKPITVADLLAVTDVCIEAWARLLESRARGPWRRSGTIRMSTQLIEEIMEITEIVEITDITGIASSSPRIRRRRDRSIALLT
jgi:hypothetical protein